LSSLCDPVPVKLSVTHTIDGPADAFWSRYLDPAWIEQLHREALGSTSTEVVEQAGAYGAGEVRRTLRYGQEPDVPGPLRKLVGDEVVSTEEGTFDPAAERWTFTLTPGSLADKTTVTGAMITTPRDDGTTDLTFTMEAKVKIIGIGGVAEKFIERQAREGQERTVAHVNAELR
jgi:hypothetical protein